jgi:hypothetical protein
MTWSSRRLISAAVITGAAVLAPVAALAAAGGPAASAAPSSPPRCATSGLVVWLDTEGSGAAGSSFYHLNFTNLSGRVCSLRGYPGVSAVGLAGRQIGSAASRDDALAPVTVRLARDATATVVVRIVDAGNFPAATCGPVTAAGLRVYPPNQTRSKVVPYPLAACSKPGPVYLTVQTVQKA